MWFTEPRSMESHGHAMESNHQIATREGIHRMHDGQIEIQIQAGVPRCKKSQKTGNCNRNNNVVTKMRAQRPESIY